MRIEWGCSKSYSPMHPKMKIAGLALTACLAPMLRAQFYEVHLTAEVDSIVGDVWDGSVSIGSPMKAVFRYDASVAPTGSLPGWSGYLFDGLVQTMTVGDYTATATYADLGIYDNSPTFGEGYQFDGFLPTGLPAPYWSFMGGRLWSWDLDLLSDTSQPVRVFDMSHFPTMQGLFLGAYTDPDAAADTRQEIDGHITGYSVVRVPTPESPSTLVLAVLGVAALVMLRRRSIG